MLRLGHIIYSNCFPPHAGIVTGKTAFPFKIVEGIPTMLNRMLYEGKIDVSPSSSIEYALNAGRYVLLPDLSITSRDRVMSIILQSRLPINDLDEKNVALTTASATSVILLRILLDLQWDVHPRFTTFEQNLDNPFEKADAALFIGDLALKLKASLSHPYLYDLGALWHEFTGLPFVFALWQVNYRKNIDKELNVLYDILLQSKSYGLENIAELANAHAQRFGIPVQVLIDYWTSFSYSLGEDEKKGLLAFYGYAAEIGAIERVKDLRFWGRSKI
jgi:chorismate dehydratase